MIRLQFIFLINDIIFLTQYHMHLWADFSPFNGVEIEKKLCLNV